jgi:hypothetical protein
MKSEGEEKYKHMPWHLTTYSQQRKMGGGASLTAGARTGRIPLT